MWILYIYFFFLNNCMILICTLTIVIIIFLKKFLCNPNKFLIIMIIDNIFGQIHKLKICNILFNYAFNLYSASPNLLHAILVLNQDKYYLLRQAVCLAFFCWRVQIDTGQLFLLGWPSARLLGLIIFDHMPRKTIAVRSR